MKIKLSELRQLIKSVIKEQASAESAQYPQMGGATQLFIENGYTVVNYTKKLPLVVTLSKDDVTVILKTKQYTGYSIQVNTKEKPNGEVCDYFSLKDTCFGITTMFLNLKPVTLKKD